MNSDKDRVVGLTVVYPAAFCERVAWDGCECTLEIDWTPIGAKMDSKRNVRLIKGAPESYPQRVEVGNVNETKTCRKR